MVETYAERSMKRQHTLRIPLVAHLRARADHDQREGLCRERRDGPGCHGLPDHFHLVLPSRGIDDDDLLDRVVRVERVGRRDGLALV